MAVVIQVGEASCHVHSRTDCLGRLDLFALLGVFGCLVMDLAHEDAVKEDVVVEGTADKSAAVESHAAVLLVIAGRSWVSGKLGRLPRLRHSLRRQTLPLLQRSLRVLPPAVVLVVGGS